MEPLVLGGWSAMLAAVALGAVSCTSAPGAEVATTAPGSPSVAIATFEAFALEHCAALQSMFRGYGNPDTASESVLMADLTAAIDTGDAPAATEAAEAVRAELEAGRSHIRAAATWPPATETMAQLDTLFAALEAMVDARLATLSAGSAVAAQEGQAAFEAAGGIDAWYAWRDGMGAVLTAAGVTELPACEGVPIH